MTADPTEIPAPSTRGPAVWVPCAAVLACLLVFLPRSMLWAERFALPKEAALHAGALACSLLVLARARAPRLDAVDMGACLFALLGMVSAVAVALNPWNGWRAALLTSSAVLLFLAARTVAGERGDTLLLEGIGWAVTALAVSALLEAYGVVDGLSTAGRAPGGALGNRNRAAHLMVLGLPVLWAALMRAPTRRRAAALLGCTASAAAMLALSHTRAAWLAAMVMAACAVAARLAIAPRAAPRRRTVGFACAAAVGIVLAIVTPNALRWAGGGGYAATMRRIGEYDAGSGRGRLFQYGITMRMAGDHPVLGVGPGNWSLHYLRYAPSQAAPSAAIVPVDRFPQSDWLGFAAERGLPALGILAYTGWLLLAWAWTTARAGASPPAERDQALALASWVAALLVLGALDVVLLTPAGACFVAVAGGALAPAREGGPVRLPRAARWSFALLMVALTAVPLTLGVQRIRAGSLVGNWFAPRPDEDRLVRAVAIDPASYEARAVLARALVQRGRCDEAAPHLAAAERLFPGAPYLARLRDGCARRGRRRGEQQLR
ncbi:MAG TPA: O-antigen ligase family protein [Longimicrobium sp.]